MTDKLRRALEGLEPLQQEVRQTHPVTGEVSWFLVELSEDQFYAFFEHAGVGAVQLDMDIYYLFLFICRKKKKPP